LLRILSKPPRYEVRHQLDTQTPMSHMLDNAQKFKYFISCQIDPNDNLI